MIRSSEYDNSHFFHTTYTCMQSLYYYDDSKHTERTNFCDYETMKWNAKGFYYNLVEQWVGMFVSVVYAPPIVTYGMK